MTQTKTKKALLMSVLSMVLCVAMLVGMTFAWFTDTASTGVNKIVAGNLNVDLEMATAWNEDGTVKTWESADGKTLTFKTKDNRPAEQILWEPGCRYELPELRVVNNGNLALKYKIAITGIKGNAKLNEVIDWTIKSGAEEYDLTAEHKLAAKTETSVSADEFIIKGEMNKDAGNEYQGLSINCISITVLATQDTVEFDSINNEYDKDAKYDINDADTEVAPSLYKKADLTNTYVVENSEGFKSLHDYIASKKLPNGSLVTLLGDVDMSGYTWSSIWAPNGGYTNVTIDGNNHTIHNLTTDPQGMFTAMGGNCVFKNMTFDNAKTNSGGIQPYGPAGTQFRAIIASQYVGNVTFDNVTIRNSIVEGYWGNGLFIGNIGNDQSNATAVFKDCKIENCTVGGMNYYLGGFAGLNENDGITFVGNNIVNGLNIRYTSYGSNNLISAICVKREGGAVAKHENVSVSNYTTELVTP